MTSHGIAVPEVATVHVEKYVDYPKTDLQHPVKVLEVQDEIEMGSRFSLLC